MPARPNHVARAATFLTGTSGTPKEKLVIGGKMLRMAVMQPEDWTPTLLTKANGILKALLDNQKLEARVAQMDEKTASKCLSQLSKDMAELADDMEKARTRKKPGVK